MKAVAPGAWPGFYILPGGGMAKILIVDDEPHIRSLLEQTLEPLEDQGVEVLIAADGMEALALVRSRKPKLVFLDVMMPGMDGCDVCRAVKDEPELRGTCIVLLTAKGQEADKRRGAAAGADCYMTKPFNPREVVDKAREVLQMNP